MSKSKGEGEDMDRSLSFLSWLAVAVLVPSSKIMNSGRESGFCEK